MTVIDNSDVFGIEGDVRLSEAGPRDFFALLKPRVMSLVVFTALVGLLVAPVSLHPLVAFTCVLFIALGAGASGALNMWWDADIDAKMRRTMNRPVPSGRIQGGEALGLGATLSGLSVVMLGLAANWLSALILPVSRPEASGTRAMMATSCARACAKRRSAGFMRKRL